MKFFVQFVRKKFCFDGHQENFIKNKENFIKNEENFYCT